MLPSFPVPPVKKQSRAWCYHQPFLLIGRHSVTWGFVWFVPNILLWSNGSQSEPTCQKLRFCPMPCSKLQMYLYVSQMWLSSGHSLRICKELMILFKPVLLFQPVSFWTLSVSLPASWTFLPWQHAQFRQTAWSWQCLSATLLLDFTVFLKTCNALLINFIYFLSRNFIFTPSFLVFMAAKVAHLLSYTLK